MLEKKITFDGFIRLIISTVVVVAVLLLINRLSGVLLPFFIAWLLAYMIYPLVKFFQYKLRLRNRILSIVMALLVITLVCTTAISLLLPPMVQEFARMKDLLFAYFVDGVNTSTVPEGIMKFFRDNVDFNFFQNLFSEENINNTLRQIVPKVWSIVSDSIYVLFSLFAVFIVLLYLFFILLDYESIAEGWLKFVPARYREFAFNLVNDVQVGMNRYFRGQALVALCVGILFSIGFLIIDFPLAIALGLFIGVLNLVPYLQILGFIPTIILAILKAADTGQNFWWILFCAVLVFGIVQILQDGIIVPKIMGNITGLNPAVILLSLSIWGSLLGIVGFIIALPLTTLILSYYQRYIVKPDDEEADIIVSEQLVEDEKETNQSKNNSKNIF
ncbi:MAG: AI-2E family transporter [Bacteroides sp.]|nr:AI-2E family transporter [Bacteroides sp.]